MRPGLSGSGERLEIIGRCWGGHRSRAKHGNDGSSFADLGTSLEAGACRGGCRVITIRGGRKGCSSDRGEISTRMKEKGTDRCPARPASTWPGCGSIRNRSGAEGTMTDFRRRSEILMKLPGLAPAWLVAITVGWWSCCCPALRAEEAGGSGNLHNCFGLAQIRYVHGDADAQSGWSSAAHG